MALMLDFVAHCRDTQTGFKYLDLGFFLRIWIQLVLSDIGSFVVSINDLSKVLKVSLRDNRSFAPFFD